MTTQTQPIELYYAATPNGRKATIMLEELGVPYHLNYVRISRGEQFRPEFLAISPNNKIPAIVDPEGPGGEAPISDLRIRRHPAVSGQQDTPIPAR